MPIEEATPSQLRAAQKTFEAADELFEGGNYEAAVKAFRTSNEIVTSPNSNLMIARALRKLGRVSEAYSVLDAAVPAAERAAAKDATKYAPTLKAVHEELAELKGTVGLLHIKLANAPAGASLTVANQPVAITALDHAIAVAPGAVEIVARADGYADQRRQINVAAGEEANVDLELAAAPPPGPGPLQTTAPLPVDPDRSTSNPLRTAAWISGGIGALGFGSFVVFGLLNRSKFSDLESHCPNDVCTSDFRSDVSSGKTFQTLANVGLVVGVVGVGAGVTLFVLSTRKRQHDAAPSAFVVVPGGAKVIGSF